MATRLPERLPPHSIEAEEAVLGSAMLSPQALHELHGLHGLQGQGLQAIGLQAGDFFRPAHGVIFEAILALHGRSEPVDVITVGQELRRSGLLERVGGPLYLHALVESVPTPASATYYAEIVAEHSHARRGIEACSDAMARFYRGEDPAAVVVEAMTRLGGPTDPGGDPARVQSGAAFALDGPGDHPVIWGRAEEVLWSAGEPFLIVGPDGSGKTTLGLRAALALVDIDGAELLGLPVRPAERPVLYIAADRPAQIRRNLARMISEADRPALTDRLRVWSGPLPFTVADEPARLAPWITGLGCGHVIIDSLGATVADLAKDEVGSRLYLALSHTVAAGIEVMVLSHPRKEGQESRRPPNRLPDVYGSRWLTAASGSVVMLSGDPGDPVVTMHHRKQPAAEVGPLQLLIEQDTGRVVVHEGSDPLAVLRAAPRGLTPRTAATALYGSDSAANVEKARRMLERWTVRGLAYRKDGDAIRGAVKSPATYYTTPPTGYQEPLD